MTIILIYSVICKSAIISDSYSKCCWKQQYSLPDLYFIIAQTI